MHTDFSHLRSHSWLAIHLVLTFHLSEKKKSIINVIAVSTVS